jgi:hypothetical protein
VAIVGFGDEYEILNETPRGASPIIFLLRKKGTEFSAQVNLFA